MIVVHQNPLIDPIHTGNQARGDQPISIIFHIGSHKAGSTSIQDFCCNNNDLLMQYKIYYPKDLFQFYPEQHSHLASLIKKDCDEEILNALEQSTKMAKFLGATQILMSGEELCLLDKNCVSRLKQLCSKFFTNYRFVFIARRRNEYAMSSFKHHLRHGERLSFSELISKIDFSPRKCLDAWFENFSPSADLLLYDEISHNLVSSFFRKVFGIVVVGGVHQNVSHDLLTNFINHLFIKELKSTETELILYQMLNQFGVDAYAIEDKIASDLVANLPDENWSTPYYSGSRSLVLKEPSSIQRSDPKNICKKMIWLFEELKRNIEKNENDTTEAEC